MELTVQREYRLYGGIGDVYARVFDGSMPRETLIYGPARTGKSLGMCLILTMICEEFPGARILMLRKTLNSMRETILVTLEEEALPSGHPALRAHNRHSPQPMYRFGNGSIIVAGGCNGPADIERIKSSQWDVVYANEATELALNDWEICLTRLSNGALPLGNFAVSDCNPDGPGHWLNRRSLPTAGGGEGRMWRVVQLLDSNPRFVDQGTGEYTPDGVKYLGVLDGLTGVRLQRLRYGKWIAAEGAIWPEWDRNVHILPKPPPPGVIRGCIGSIDWGFAAPGCAGVWGVDADNRAYLLAQVYRAEMSDDWWLEVCNELTDEFGVKAWAADPEDAGAIAKFRRAGLPMHEAKKRVAAGLDAVRDRLRVAHDGRPRLFVVADNLRHGVCPVCVEKRWPTCLEEEIPEYVYAEYEEGKPIKEIPAPGQADHGCDMARYLVMHVDAVDFRTPLHAQPLPPTSIGVEDEYEEIMRRSRLGLPHDGSGGKWRDRARERRRCWL